MRNAVFLDIDGTLRKQNVQVPRIPVALLEVLGIDVRAHDVLAAGQTDLSITTELARRAGVAEALVHESLDELFRAQERHFEVYHGRIDVQPLPGVLELLRALRERGDIVGTVTGNVERIAERKLEQLGIRDFFDIVVGGDRGFTKEELLQLAMDKAGITERTALTRGNVTYVGDTPGDMVSARNAGVKVIGVATGRHAIEELQVHRPDYAFPDLRDTVMVVKSIEEKRQRIGRGYSLWLVPPEPLNRQMGSMIDRLSARYEMPAFPPHLTLAGPIREREHFLNVSEMLSEELRPVTVTFDGFGMHDGYFRQLCMTARRTDELVNANRMAANAYGAPYRDSYMPHSSLLYAYFPHGDLESLTAELHRSIPLPRSFHAETAQLWSTVGPIQEWHQIDEIKLNGKRYQKIM
jgi:phosphoglycolate phosphatase